MRKPLSLLVILAACGSDVAATLDGPTSSTDGPKAVSGSITADTTWSGTVDLAGPTVIPAGVTVTVAAGTTIVARKTASIDVAGKLDVQGTTAAHVTLKPADGATFWLGLTISGTLEMHYADEVSGGIVVNNGEVTVIDSVLSHFNNVQDYLIMNSGSIDVEYSTFAPLAGTSDRIHCDMHANSGGGGLMIKVVHSNLSGGTYGFDFFGGSGNLVSNNWFSNSTNLYTEPGAPVTGDVSGGWFEGGAPMVAAGSSITKNNLSATKLTDAGPRP